MDDKRQKTQKELASKARVGSEASDGAMRGFESFEAVGATESLATTEHMLEEVLDKENLKEALSKVLANKGAAGIDGMTVDKLPDYLKENWKRIRKELLEESYAPRAVRRVEIPKATGGVRQLGIPTVVSLCNRPLHPNGATASISAALGRNIFPAHLLTIAIHTSRASEPENE